MLSFVRIPDTDEAQRRLGVLIAAGDPPDIILPTGVFGIALYLDQNVWLDLAPLMAEHDVDLSLFQTPAIRAAQAVNYYGENTRTVVGLPAGIFTHTIAYNKQLFADAGVPEPPHQWDAPNWTYDRLVEVAKTLTRDSRGRTPEDAGFNPGDIVQFGLGHWDTGLMVLGFGGQKYDPAARRVQFDDDAYIDGVRFGADLLNVHHVLATDELVQGAGAQSPQLAAWKSGNVAMIDMCGCDLATWGSGNDFEWDVAPWPKGPEELVSTLNLDLGAIVSRSANHEAAFEALRFLLVEPSNARTLSTKGYGAMSPLKSEEGAFIDELSGAFPDIDLQLFLDAIPFSRNQEEWFPAYTEINDLQGQFLDPVNLGQAEAAPQLRSYQQAAQAAVEQWFETHELPSA